MKPKTLIKMRLPKFNYDDEDFELSLQSEEEREEEEIMMANYYDAIIDHD